MVIATLKKRWKMILLTSVLAGLSVKYLLDIIDKIPLLNYNIPILGTIAGIVTVALAVWLGAYIEAKSSWI